MLMSQLEKIIKEYLMNKKLKSLVIPFIFFVIAIASLIYLEVNIEITTTVILISLVTFILEYSTGSLFSKVLSIFEGNNWKTSQRKLVKENKLQPDTKIRISFAYLFRIKIDNHYFLIQNNRTKKYQPVGGAYKFSEKEKYYLSNTFSLEDDDRIPVGELTKLDYRLFVKNKDLRNFFKRFNKTTQRENIENLSREFIEEIFNSGILNLNDFGTLTYKYCGRHITQIEDTVFWPFEILLADIIEVRLTAEQENLFKGLMEKKSEKYIFATSKDIKHLGVKIGTHELGDSIANHTHKILTEKSDDLVYRNKYKNTISIIL